MIRRALQGDTAAGGEVEMRPEIFRRGRHLGKSPYVAQGHRITADGRTGDDVERARSDALLSLRLVGRPTKYEAGRQQSSQDEKPGRGEALEHGKYESLVGPIRPQPSFQHVTITSAPADSGD